MVLYVLKRMTYSAGNNKLLHILNCVIYIGKWINTIKARGIVLNYINKYSFVEINSKVDIVPEVTNRVLCITYSLNMVLCESMQTIIID